MPPANGGFIEYAWTAQSPGGKYRKITANWKVPPKPAGVYSGTRVYFSFPALFNDSYILQPVLQYGYNGQFGGSYWTIASWRCNSICDHSAPITVNAGEVLSGSVVASNCAGGNCTWTITAKRVSTGQSAVHVVPSADAFVKATKGAVEVYGLTACNQYPTNGIFFTDAALYNGSMSQVFPTWTKYI